jgi:hypothetical protein
MRELGIGVQPGTERDHSLTHTATRSSTRIRGTIWVCRSPFGASAKLITKTCWINWCIARCLEGLYDFSGGTACTTESGSLLYNSLHDDGPQISAWVITKIEQRCRAWFWRGEGTCHGGHCWVHWDIVYRPKQLGGLGVHDLKKFGRALWLRWLWITWRNPERPWVGMPLPCDAVDRQLFAGTTWIGSGFR